MKTSFPLALLALVILLAWCSVPREATRGAIDHASLNPIRIHAYRDWQSTGVRLHQGDLLTVEAEGEWTYTPGEVHGPEGHRIYRAPSFYPLPSAPGGVLIGRIGEEGAPFHVGRRLRRPVQEEGLLYLRIDDDILSDNEGYVTVEVQVASPETE
jgi:hypothetical protein